MSSLKNDFFFRGGRGWKLWRDMYIRAWWHLKTLESWDCCLNAYSPAWLLLVPQAVSDTVFSSEMLMLFAFVQYISEVNINILLVISREEENCFALLSSNHDLTLTIWFILWCCRFLYLGMVGIKIMHQSWPLVNMKG